MPAKAAWPLLELRRRRGSPRPAHDVLTESHAEFRLQTGGEITVDRARGRAVFTTPEPPSPAELVHPFLAPVAAVMGYWHGRETFHAGAFVYAGSAWALVGDRESGKSTILAQLALAGVPVICDDMLVLEDGVPFAAPRSIDLRPSAARKLGAGKPMGVVGARERWRLPLGPVGEAPLSGWIFLGWGESLEWREMNARARIEQLSAQRGLRVPARDPARLLDLVSLPSWELRRPRSWLAFERSVELLLTRLAE